MKRFELPLAEDRISVRDAIEEMIDARTSGLLVRRPAAGDLVIVDFDGAVAAHEAGVSDLRQIDAKHVLDLAGGVAEGRFTDPMEIAHALHSGGGQVAFLGASRDYAQLFSTTETIADILSFASSGVHCQRPNLPPGMKPRQWYHYYPPLKRDPFNLHVCTQCKSYLP